MLNNSQPNDKYVEYENIISSTSSTGIFDVIIVGAGPVGLATAIGLYKRGITNILVIDQTRTFRQVGQIVDLLPNGLKALKYIDEIACEEVKKAGMGYLNSLFFKSKNQQDSVSSEAENPDSSPKWFSKNLQGEITHSIPLSYDYWHNNYGEGRVSISWYDLQTTLRNQLPEYLVKANHRCVNLVEELYGENEKTCIRIDCISTLEELEKNPYAYWESNPNNINNINQPLELIPKKQLTATKSIRGKIIIAADGINSTIRRILYTNNSENAFTRPKYSGFAAIYCTEISEISQEIQTELETGFLKESSLVTIGDESPRMVLFRHNNSIFGYLLHIALPLELLQDKSGSLLIDLALQQLEKANYPEVLKKLVAASSHEKMLQRPYYIHHAESNPENQLESQPAWNAGSVVLAGDAAHGMPPFMAQGANQGLEDALALTTAIANIALSSQWDDTQAISQAFSKYDRLRRPIMAYVQRATLTRFPYISNRHWQDYNDQIYSRNLEPTSGVYL
ncbi:FAD-dependent oxidoreductase [Brunnivagina elsteri]|uniref:FAD-binding monooxygenase n=1 Tax=Brunnivagina elsteri CCALA 953 TaxID=987040 RepID=A0A2A2TDZ5_9CYAN|nr:NAD(P)/FAD-dependent oxidoreductase [Calothrix elsteri]PAX51866.1 FAD-binding monooxygenase [Calothrix elsteri CCALA 953]